MTKEDVKDFLSYFWHWILLIVLIAAIVIIIGLDISNEKRKFAETVSYLLETENYDTAMVISKDKGLPFAALFYPHAVVLIGNKVTDIPCSKSIFPDSQ